MIVKEKRETINEVTLQGGITHKFSTDKVTILTLATKGPNSVMNYPKAVFFGEAKKQADQFDKGDFVRVSGNIQSSKRNPNIENQVTLAVFGEGVQRAKTVMEDAFNIEGKYIPHQNEFKLAGSVVSIVTATPGILVVTVRTNKNGRPSFVSLTKFVNNKKGSNTVTDVCVGDFVYAVGHVQTHKSDKNGEVKYFQNYVVSELKK